MDVARPKSLEGRKKEDKREREKEMKTLVANNYNRVIIPDLHFVVMVYE